MIPIWRPLLGGNELRYVKDCVESGWISSQGKYVHRFEEEYQEKYFNEPIHCLTTSNGTTALQLALSAIGVKGGEVIVPDSTFCGVSNAVVACGATPVYAPILNGGWNIYPPNVEPLVTKNTKAIIAVHSYGHACNVPGLMKYGIPVIEDCAEAHGAKYNGKIVGSMGTISCFSFYANKIITTGEGGMVCTRDDDLHEKMRLLCNHGMDKDYRLIEPGFNYRMTNLQAAVGCAQLEMFDHILWMRNNIQERYQKELDVEVPDVCWMANLETPDRDNLRKKLFDLGVETRPGFPSLKSSHGSERIAKRILSLPSGNGITPSEIKKVIAAVNER